MPPMAGSRAARPGGLRAPASAAPIQLRRTCWLMASSAIHGSGIGAQNIDIDKNYGLDVLKIPGTNGTDPLQGGYPAIHVQHLFQHRQPECIQPVSVPRQSIRHQRQRELAEGVALLPLRR